MKTKHVILALCIIVATACSIPDSTPSTDEPVLLLDATNYPRVDGSTSTHPLQTTIACYWLEVECQWVLPFMSSDGTKRYLPAAYINNDENYEPAIEAVMGIEHSGTHGSYVNLILGQSDLILVARLPSEDELSMAAEMGVELIAQPIAHDAFVFLVNDLNTVESLTIDQIRSVFSGEITRWEGLGVSGWPEYLTSIDGGARIQPYLRNPNSGSQELMETLVMGELAMIDGPDLIVISGMGPVFSALHMDPFGIGYSVYYYAVYMLPTEGVRLLGIDGIIPNDLTIASGSYPFTTKVYAVIRSNLEEDESAHQLFDWLLTPEGQNVIGSSGYVPLN